MNMSRYSLKICICCGALLLRGAKRGYLEADGGSV